MSALVTDSLTPLAWVYVGIAIGWSLIFVGICGFLWRHRHLPSLQIRRLPLVFAALGVLHTYGTITFIAYILGPRFPCAIEFWVMNLLLPLGFALFQISNSQFLYIAARQERFGNKISPDELIKAQDQTSLLDGQSGSLRQRNMQRLRSMDQITRMAVYVGIAMSIQVALTLVIYLLSRKFHPSFGLLPDNFDGTDAQVRLSCARGWEWWLSIVWQFFWTWLYAPSILFKSRKIQDSHGWRTQTILCCIIGLPASPLWLSALYLDAFTSVNAVWVPPQWFAASIALLEGVTLFVPLPAVWKQQEYSSRLAAVTGWETQYAGPTGYPRAFEPQNLPLTSCSLSEKGLVLNNSRSVKSLRRTTQNNQLCTMNALESALRRNPEPLQQYAALKDFSGENIAFLTNVMAWSNSWQNRRSATTMSQSGKRDLFDKAVTLYAAFIAPQYAEFPINISSSTLRNLEGIFATAATAMFGKRSSQKSLSSATPFDMPDEDCFFGKGSPVWQTGELFQVDSSDPSTDVPADFGSTVFARAEAEIKYLVLTNTWPKFVEIGMHKAASGYALDIS